MALGSVDALGVVTDMLQVFVKSDIHGDGTCRHHDGCQYDEQPILAFKGEGVDAFHQREGPFRTAVVVWTEELWHKEQACYGSAGYGEQGKEAEVAQQCRLGE